MKKRFYIDVPEFGEPDYQFCAWETPPAYPVQQGYKRIAFDVNFPPSVFKTNTDVAVASIVGVMDGESE